MVRYASIINPLLLDSNLTKHYQAFHNIRNAVEAYKIRDPSLTPFGHLQCESVSKTFPHMDKITHILCSPLTRTLETALECFKPVLDRGVKIVAWRQLVEFGNGEPNKGYKLPDLKKKVEGLPIDLRYLTEGWDTTPNLYADGPARARKAAKTLHSFCQVCSRSGGRASDRLDVELVVVSHATFLRYLLCERESSRLPGYLMKRANEW